MKEPPEIDPKNLEIAVDIIASHQDKKRATKQDTSYLSRIQRDLQDLIEYYSNPG